LRIVTRDAPLPRVRIDALPDETDYRDTGCELAKSCLQCPFERCKHDVRGGAQRLSAEARDREIALLHRKHGVPAMLLAYTYGVSRRTVFRALRAHPPDGPAPVAMISARHQAALVARRRSTAPPASSAAPSEPSAAKRNGRR
jgi:hypothetical protein